MAAQAVLTGAAPSSELKLKVLEVNQDMEELRMSIEKSLAELTAMETSDDMPDLISVSVNDQSLPKACAHIASETNTEKLPVVRDADLKQEVTDKTQASLSPSPQTSQQHPKHNKGKGKTTKKNKCEHSAQPATETHRNAPDVALGSADNKSIVVESQKIKATDTSKDRQSTTEPQVSASSDSAASTEIKKTETETTKASKDGQPQGKVKGNQQSMDVPSSTKDIDSKASSKNVRLIKSKTMTSTDTDFETIETFEDAMTSSLDDVNKNFEVIVKENTDKIDEADSQVIVIPIESPEALFATVTEKSDATTSLKTQDKVNPIVSRSKNFLGHPNIPVTSSKNDFKKERNKTPNAKQAKVRIKDSEEIENPENDNKRSQQSQTCVKLSNQTNSIIKKEPTPVACDNDEEEFVYKYSFRKVFLTSSCHVCKTELKSKSLPCCYCNLIFYCGQKHKDEDWGQHQAFCFAVSTICHLKGLKFIYADARGVRGQEYRLLRMQMIVSCEKILKRRLEACEQEALLYPRACADPACREWRVALLTDCDNCGQVAYCTGQPEHAGTAHAAWCRAHRLYARLVARQHAQGRLEPALPTRVLAGPTPTLPGNLNELLSMIFEQKLDMDEVEYAALTQLATAPLTAVYAHQLYKQKVSSLPNGIQQNKTTFTVHVVGAELQFEADTLNKWEVFFLHLRPDLEELRVVFIGPELNPSNLPLELLAKIKLCPNCRQSKRRVVFEYQDGQLYHEYAAGTHFTVPDLVCAFNPGLHRSTGFSGADTWPDTITCILKLKTPFCVTSYTRHELPRDLARVRDSSKSPFQVLVEPCLNPYASIRPDRNFISDDEMPLIFKNYYFMILCGGN